MLGQSLVARPAIVDPTHCPRSVPAASEMPRGGHARTRARDDELGRRTACTERRICRRPGDEPAAPTGSGWETAHLPSLDWPDGPCDGRGRERCTKGGASCDIVLSSWSRQASGSGSPPLPRRRLTVPPRGRLSRSPAPARSWAAPPTGSPTSRERCSSTARWSPGSTSTRRIPTTSPASGSRTAGPTEAPGVSSPVSASTAERAGKRL